MTPDHATHHATQHEHCVHAHDSTTHRCTTSWVYVIAQLQQWLHPCLTPSQYREQATTSDLPPPQTLPYSLQTQPAGPGRHIARLCGRYGWGSDGQCLPRCAACTHRHQSLFFLNLLINSSFFCPFCSMRPSNPWPGGVHSASGPPRGVLVLSNPWQSAACIIEHVAVIIGTSPCPEGPCEVNNSPISRYCAGQIGI